VTFDSTTTVPQWNFFIQLQGITDYPIQEVAGVVNLLAENEMPMHIVLYEPTASVEIQCIHFMGHKRTVMHVGSSKRNNYSLSINPQQINGNERTRSYLALSNEPVKHPSTGRKRHPLYVLQSETGITALCSECPQLKCRQRYADTFLFFHSFGFADLIFI
jgi:hypothetical protein